MTTLDEYLALKRDAFRALKPRAPSPGHEPVRLRARVSAEGRSGVRRIRVRDFRAPSPCPFHLARRPSRLARAADRQ